MVCSFWDNIFTHSLYGEIYTQWGVTSGKSKFQKTEKCPFPVAWRSSIPKIMFLGLMVWTLASGQTYLAIVYIVKIYSKGHNFVNIKINQTNKKINNSLELSPNT